MEEAPELVVALVAHHARLGWMQAQDGEALGIGVDGGLPLVGVRGVSVVAHRFPDALGRWSDASVAGVIEGDDAGGDATVEAPGPGTATGDRGRAAWRRQSASSEVPGATRQSRWIREWMKSSRGLLPSRLRSRHLIQLLTRQIRRRTIPSAASTDGLDGPVRLWDGPTHSGHLVVVGSEITLARRHVRCPGAAAGDHRCRGGPGGRHRGPGGSLSKVQPRVARPRSVLQGSRASRSD